MRCDAVRGGTERGEMKDERHMKGHNKKLLGARTLLGTSASLLVTSALLVTRNYWEQRHRS